MNPPSNSKYKILVVDDDLELNTGFALLLEFDGHEVHAAYTAESALDMLAKDQFDLLIAEYWLPHMTGDQLVSLVKQRWPDLPVIMVTANFGEIHMEDHPVSGVDCLLDKPFSMDQLREAIRWTLERQIENQPDIPDSSWVHVGRHISPKSPQKIPKGPADF